MGREDFEVLKSGVLKRKTKRRLAIFIDGVGLDRATRRLERKVDLGKLVTGITTGIPLELARYYTLIPHEDDARQFAFLDAVERAGLEVVVKRLPPKGVKRQVSMDVHIATDLISYSFGLYENLRETSDKKELEASFATDKDTDELKLKDLGSLLEKPIRDPNIKRMAVVICPNREMSYGIYMSHLLGVETSLADFGLYGTSDGWRGVDRWIDLSTSETIWRD